MIKYCKRCDKDTERTKRGECLPCKKESARIWYKNNSDKVKEGNREWRKANPKKVSLARCKKYKTNAEKNRDIRREWRKANPEKKASQNKKYRDANPRIKLDEHLPGTKSKAQVREEFNRRCLLAEDENLGFKVGAGSQAYPKVAITDICLACPLEFCFRHEEAQGVGILKSHCPIHVGVERDLDNDEISKMIKEGRGK